MVRVLALPAAAAVLDARVLVFTAVVSIVTAVLFGLAPAFISTRAEGTLALNNGSMRSGTGRSPTQTALLVLQAALSLVVLAGAGLFVRSLRNIREVDLGMDASHVVLADLKLPESGYDSAARAALYDRLVERVSALPGVVGVSYEAVPRFRALLNLAVSLPGRDSMSTDRRGTPVNFVGPDYLRANGTPLRSGRDISDQDRARTLRVAVVNETMAKRFWPAANPLGRCILVHSDEGRQRGGASSGAPPCTYVVGVMADGKYLSLTEDPTPFYLLPNSQQRLEVGPHGLGPMPTLIVRGRGDPHRLAPEVRRAIEELAPDIPSVDVHALADVVDPQIQPYRIGAVLFTSFGLVALFLAAIGLFGVVSYVVTQRTREVGVRLALGARGAHVRALMVRQGMVPALVGTAIGLLGALYVTRYFSNQLYGVSPTDPLTLGAVAVGLCAVAALACYVPARRAARVDPVIAMRVE